MPTFRYRAAGRPCTAARCCSEDFMTDAEIPETPETPDTPDATEDSPDTP